MLVGWYLASTEMQAAKKKQISKYSQSFSKIQNIRRVSAVTVDDGAEADVVAHPNSKTAEKMEEQLEATVEAVVEAWRLKRERQEPLMQFSKELLGEDTYQFLSSSKAPELLSNGDIYEPTGHLMPNELKRNLRRRQGWRNKEASSVSWEA
jgi:hypothetical protein